MKMKRKKKTFQKKVRSRLCKSDITPPLRFLLLEELTGFLFSCYLTQFLSNFLKYSFSNFLSFHLYNIFTMYFPGNSPLLKSLSSALSNLSYCLISAFILSSNSATTSFMFSKFFFFSQLSYSIINPFYHTKYYTIQLIFTIR